jgi:hypothetical protein
MHRVEEQGTGRFLTSFSGEVPRRGDTFVFGHERFRISDVEWRPVTNNPNVLIANVLVTKGDM